MALSVIIVLYVCVGILAAAGSIFISQKLFSAKAEQIFFALFLVAIAGFYLAFTACSPLISETKERGDLKPER